MGPASKEKVAKGVAWQGAAKWGAQLLNFGFYTGLARLLSPSIFGLVAIAWVYLAFIQVFVRQGFGDAIIQRRDLEPEHLDSAFWIAMGTAVLLCLLSIALAGPIARLFSEPRVAPVIEWMSLFFPLAALGAMPTAILTRELNFRPLAVSSVLGTGVGGAVGLTMALYGWGVWSLVGQQLINVALICFYLWLVVPWRPSLRVSKRHVRDLYGFSLSITGNDILWFFAQKSDQTMVGYGFGAVALGPYSIASRVSTLLHDAIIGPLQSVAFPAFSRLQSDKAKLEQALHKFCEMSSFVSMPVFAGLAVVAPELIPVLFGPKWSAAVPILQILAVYVAVRGVLAFVNPIMLAKDRTTLFFSMNIALAVLTFVGCLVAVRWSPAAIALSMVVALSVFGLFEVIVISVKVLKTSPVALLRNFAFPVLSSLFMVAVVAVVRGLVVRDLAPLATLAVCVTVGAAVYICSGLWLRFDLVSTIWGMAGSTFLHSTPRKLSGNSESKAELATSVTEQSVER